MCVCILAVVIRHENRVFSVSRSLSHVACLALRIFPTLSHTAGFWGKVPECKIYLISSSTLSEISLIVRRIPPDVIIILKRSSCEVPVILDGI